MKSRKLITFLILIAGFTWLCEIERKVSQKAEYVYDQLAASFELDKSSDSADEQMALTTIQIKNK